MSIDEIVNDVIAQTLEVANLPEEDQGQELVNIHTEAVNRLQGYDDQGNLGKKPE